MSNYSEIKAVLFDADGVIIPPWRFANYLQTEHNITFETTAEFFKGVFVDCLRGQADLKQALPTYLGNWKWSGSTEDFVSTWLEKENVINQDIKNIVTNLRKQGVFCALASNQEKNRATYIREEMRFNEIFDRTFFSFEIGAVKPELLYYSQITNNLNLNPDEILFFDDNEKHVIGAIKAGWQAYLFTDLDSIVDNIQKNLPTIRLQ